LLCFYDCVQHVVKIGSSVTQISAFRHRGSVTVTMTVEICQMNKTAVSAFDYYVLFALFISRQYHSGQAVPHLNTMLQIPKVCFIHSFMHSIALSLIIHSLTDLFVYFKWYLNTGSGSILVPVRPFKPCPLL